jgi:hypothetical protein
MNPFESYVVPVSRTVHRNVKAVLYMHVMDGVSRECGSITWKKRRDGQQFLVEGMSKSPCFSTLLSGKEIVSIVSYSSC